ncbi:unnamed protein product [Mytilus coruscus]|uniref:DDE Tnp4 domain-containing protein n=1 Tax=Mytilus coruscus TaxID=42192 RepID=A0A6J8D798_MYTCO|nr:unnamed protein product [Mytilus coruscus]
MIQTRDKKSEKTPDKKAASVDDDYLRLDDEDALLFDKPKESKTRSKTSKASSKSAAQGKPPSSSTPSTSKTKSSSVSGDANNNNEMLDVLKQIRLTIDISKILANQIIIQLNQSDKTLVAVSLDITENQCQWILDHLVHTMDVHRVHYRQTSDLIERVHVSKLLLIQDFGKVKDFVGKTLEDIQLQVTPDTGIDNIAEDFIPDLHYDEVDADYSIPIQPGSISDNEICTAIGFYKLLQQIKDIGYIHDNDSIMADKGFRIEKDLNDLKMKLNIPPFASSATQMSAGDVTLTRKIAAHRIHIERSINKKL